MSILKRYIFPVLLLSAAMWLLYRWLGKESLEFEITEVRGMEIRGYEFNGRPTQPELEKYFFEMRDKSALEQGKYLTIVSFGKEDNVDTLRQFIGTQNPAVTDVPDTYQIQGGRYVRTRIDMNSMFRPSPGRVRQEASEFAASRQIKLDNRNLEIYTGEQELTILFPLLED